MPQFGLFATITDDRFAGVYHHSRSQSSSQEIFLPLGESTLCKQSLKTYCRLVHFGTLSLRFCVVYLPSLRTMSYMNNDVEGQPVDIKE